MPEKESSGWVPGISGSQGVVVGSGNAQYNVWMPKQPLDPVALGALNPHVAVARLQQLSHDELVDFFARASPGDVSEIIDTMFHVDVEKLATILADVNRRKATELIEGSRLDPRLFRSLPEASEAISRKAVIWGWAQAGSMQVWAQGYSRVYNEGNVFWRSADGVAWTIKGAIGRYVECARIGTERNFLGFPIGDEERAPTSSFGTEGFRQAFENGTVYSSLHGTFSVPKGGCYETERSSGGWLGFPVGNMQKNGTLGLLQSFEGGVIYYHGDAEKKSFAVVQDIVNSLPNDRKSRPVSAEDVVKQSSGEGRTIQRFEIGSEWGTSETAVTGMRSPSQ